MYRLIVVEDESLTREGIVAFFDWHAMGFEVSGQFEDGSDAIAFLARNPVELVLSDVCMYEVSGLELAKYLFVHCPRTRLVMLSAYREFDYARQAMRYGAKDYLCKPIDREQMHAVLARIKSELDEERHGKVLLPMPEKALAEQTDIVRLACEYVDAHLSQELSLAQIAGHVFYSESHFSREFRAAMGMSAMDYVVGRRLARAEELLRSTALPGQEIARQVGYADARYFQRVFRRHTGMTIRQYRQRHAAAREASIHDES